jgi:uncharacterized OB-fold protein
VKPKSDPMPTPALFSTEPPALLGAKCVACGSVRFPAAPVCARCQSTDTAVVPLATTGTVYSFTIVRASPPGYLGSVPYGLGIVELADGLRVESTLTAPDLSRIAIGDRVEFELITLGAGDEAMTSFAFRQSGRPS